MYNKIKLAYIKCFLNLKFTVAQGSLCLAKCCSDLSIVYFVINKAPDVFKMHTNPQEFSKYIVYVDESGDHGLLSIDTNYPVFVLAFCIFEKANYAEVVSPAVSKFKFKHFGHDMVVLHEQKIRKAIDDFKILINAEYRQVFMSDLNLLMQEAPFTLIAVGINKLALQEKYIVSSNPYHLALYIGLERIYDFLLGKDYYGKTLHIVFESRGKKEDAELELEFRRVCAGNNVQNLFLPFQLVFADKRSNSCGLQLADLVARPVGRYLLNNTQENRAYEILEKKFYKRHGKIKDYGLKCFP